MLAITVTVDFVLGTQDLTTDVVTADAKKQSD
jgi:hypothetical protein